jgi:hypothetical protein
MAQICYDSKLHYLGTFVSNEKRWKAIVCYDSKTHNLGLFDTKQEAALVYDREARQCGKDKLLNYESIKAAEDAAAQTQAERVLVHDVCAGSLQLKPRPASKQLKTRPPSGFYGVYTSGKQWSRRSPS